MIANDNKRGTIRSANVLRTLREQAEHTQGSAARMIGLSERTWRRYEAGESKIPVAVWLVVEDKW